MAMKILLYTQISGATGSLRLFLNLARHLQQSHQICLAFDRGGAGEVFLKYFPDIPVIDCRQAADFSSDCDLLLCHLPHEIDGIVDIPVPKKIAVCMEVASVHEFLIDNDNAHRFDAVLYLHDEQIEHFSPSLRAQKCIRVPLINNIEAVPDYVKTGHIGCIGTRTKHDLDLLSKVLENTASHRKIKIWAPWPLLKKTKNKNTPDHPQLSRYHELNRWVDMGVDPDVYSIQAQYDALLHTPGWSNGTSTVISDALASGKIVLLSPLPAFKKAYGGMPGIYFLDDPHLEIENLLQNYGKNQYEFIRDGYGAVYNRAAALQQWQCVIERNFS